MSNEYDVLILIAELENDKNKPCNWLKFVVFSRPVKAAHINRM